MNSQTKALILFIVFSQITTFYLASNILKHAIIGLPYGSWQYTIFFYGRRILPFILLTCYFFLKFADTPRFKKLLDSTATCSVIFASVVVLPVVIANLSVGNLEPVLFGVSFKAWSHHAIIEWILLFTGMFFLARKKLGVFQAFTFTFLGLQTAGILYELCLLGSAATHVVLIDHTFPLYTGFAVPGLFVYLLYVYRWHPNKMFWVAIVPFVGFSIFYRVAVDAAYPFIFYWFFGWLPRIPASLLILSTAFSLPVSIGRKTDLP